MIEVKELHKNKFKIIIYHGHIHKIPIDEREEDPNPKMENNKNNKL